MKRAEYKKLKKQVEEQYEIAIQESETRRIEGLAAIEKVWRMFHPPRKRVVVLNGGEKDNVSSSLSYGSLMTAVRKSLDLTPEIFTVNNIRTIIAKTYENTSFNTNSIAGCLNRLLSKGVIEVVEKGRGSSPSKYRIKNRQKEIT